MTPISSHSFIGREHELSDLHAGLEAALAGDGRLFLLSGDPGIGKTRLSDEIAQAAAGRGAQVLWGRCWEGGGAPAYWPWVQILRPLVSADLPPAARLPERLALLAHLLPEIAQASSVPTVRAADEAEDQRFRLFDAAHGLLASVAAKQALVLIIDDIHAADAASLLLLRFVARALRGNAILIIATHREAEVRTSRRLAESIGALARDARTLPLRGLGLGDVASFLHTTLGTVPSETLAAALYQATGGNPFFLDEIVRLMRAEGRFALPDTSALAGFSPPEQVREAVRRQLRLLPAPIVEVLTIAAVLGQEFHLSLLERVFPESASEPLSNLAESAIAAGVLHLESSAAARYTFAHALYREVLYDSIPAATRAVLHQRAGAALEAMYGNAVERPLAKLAHHHLEAGSAKGLDYSQATADDALHRLAYEEAVHWYDTALAALERIAAGDDRRRLKLRLQLGNALKAASDFERARHEFLAAAELARRIGDAEALADAAVGIVPPFMDGRPDPTSRALVEEALSRIAPDDSRLRARLLLLLAHNLYFTARPQAVALLEESVAMARRVGHVPTLAMSLMFYQFALGDEGRADEALALSDEALTALAALEGGGSRETLSFLGLELVRTQMWRGDIGACDAAIERFDGLATLQRKRFWSALALGMRAMRAAMQGSFERADEFMARAAEMDRQRGPGSAWQFLIRLFNLREREETTPDIAAQIPEEMIDVHQIRALLAVLACDRGNHAEARSHLERGAALGFASLAHDWNGSSALAQYAEVCARLGEHAHARTIYDALANHAGLVAAFDVHFSFGAAARYLGLLATCFEDWALAAQHFEAALAMNTRMGARPWLAHSECDYAAMLLRAGSVGPDQPSVAARQRALILLKHAEDTARDLGMRPLQKQVAALLAELDEVTGYEDSRPPIAAAVSDPPSPRTVALFRRDGEYWTLAYEGTRCRIKHTKGVDRIAYLLRNIGEEVHASALLDLGEDRAEEPVADAATPIRKGLGDAGEMLDSRAREEYRRRLLELRADIDAAEDDNDMGRAENAREELEALQAELSRAVGIGGRARRAGSHAERARVNVTRSISTTIDKIGEHHAALGRHLADAIRTGTFCSYRPTGVPPEWELQ